MEEKILQAIYDFWCSSGKDLRPEVGEAMKNLQVRFSVTDSGKDYLFLESEVLRAVIASEKAAFQDGFTIGTNLAHGRYSLK